MNEELKIMNYYLGVPYGQAIRYIFFEKTKKDAAAILHAKQNIYNHN